MRMRSKTKRGSAIVMTLFLVLLASLAMSRFIERAYSEILGEAVHIERHRLRFEAFSVLEATVASVYDIFRMTGALHSPEQGWADPVEYAGIVLPEGLTVNVSYVDEMGKISLPVAGRDRLMRLFEVLGFMPVEAEDLAEALLEWTGTEGAGLNSNLLDYERAELPYLPPRRPLRTLHELAAIHGFRQHFFDAQGVPNQLFHQMEALVSLYRFNQVNINTASPLVIRIWSNLTEQEAANLERSVPQGNSEFPYFRNLQEASAAYGFPIPDALYAVATTCLRVNITVSEGGSSYVLSAVLAPGAAAAANLLPQGPQGGGQEQQPGATTRPRRGERVTQPRPGSQQPQQPAAGGAQNAANNIPYPFTFLEIQENAAILALNLSEEI
jgi:type II secretory pathway component PulK